MRNYYEILEIPSDSSTQDIKKAFRAKAKKLHPDIAQKSKEIAEETAINEMRVLLQAYKVLIDSEKRKHYDRKNNILKDRSAFDYRKFLQERINDYDSQSKLIFFDLLHNNEDSALELYDSLLQNGDFFLHYHMDREDFMDCAFLLAEEYLAAGEPTKAYGLLIKIAHFEYNKSYFRHFFEEVISRLKKIVCNHLPGKIEDTQLLEYYFELARLQFSPKETAFFYKKIAEIYEKLNNKQQAEFYLKKSIELDDKISGVNKLKIRLGIG